MWYLANKKPICDVRWMCIQMPGAWSQTMSYVPTLSRFTPTLPRPVNVFTCHQRGLLILASCREFGQKGSKVSQNSVTLLYVQYRSLVAGMLVIFGSTMVQGLGSYQQWTMGEWTLKDFPAYRNERRGGLWSRSLHR